MLDGEYKGMAVPSHSLWVKSFPATTTRENVQKMQEMAKRDLDLLGFTSFKQLNDPPKVDPARRFLETIMKDDENPMGKVFAFNPA